MRNTLLALLMLGVPAVAAGAQPEGEYSFAPPIQWEGDSISTGLDWILIVMGPMDDGLATFEASGPQQVLNHSAVRLGSDSSQAGGFGTWNLPSSGYTEPTPTDGQLEFQPGAWKSLYVEGADLRLAVRGQGIIGPLAEGTAVETGFDDRNHPAATTHLGYHRIAERTVGLASLRGGAEPFHLEVAGQDVRVAEWQNATTQCTTEACWPSSPSEGRTVGGQSATVLRYTEVITQGALNFQGNAWAVAAGSRSLSMQLVGELRLPGLEREASCNACVDPAGATLTLTGNNTLADLQWQDDKGGRFASTIASHSGNVRLDETVVDPALLGLVGTTATAAVAGAGLAILAVKALLPLFTRIRLSKALENPRRRAILDLVNAQPGRTFGQLVRSSGIAAGTLRHHLIILSRLHLVEAVTRGNTLRHYPVGLDRSRHDSLAVLQDTTCRELCDLIGASPGLLQKDLLAAYAGRIPRSSVQFKLRQLLQANVIGATRLGKRTVYSPGKFFPLQPASPNSNALAATA